MPWGFLQLGYTYGKAYLDAVVAVRVEALEVVCLLLNDLDPVQGAHCHHFFLLINASQFLDLFIILRSLLQE